MRALTALLLVACTIDREPEHAPVVDAYLAPVPADFGGLAPCAAGMACPCCCFTGPCEPADGLHCEESGDAMGLPQKYHLLCASCLAGDLDAGAACSVVPG